MPEFLFGPVGIALLALILGVLLAVLIVQSRRRAKNNEVLPPPELTEQIDYTSVPYEEPLTWSDRLQQSSPVTKILLVLLPLVLIASLVIVYLAFLQPLNNETTAEAPSPPPPTVSNATALVTNPDRVVVQAQTSLPNGTQVNAAMRQNGEEFPWFTTESATTRVANGRINMSLNRSADAPVPEESDAYAVALSATLPDGQMVTFDPIELEIPSPNRAGFFQIAAAAPTPAPSPTPRPQPTPAPAAPQPTVEPTPEVVEATEVLTATVFNGGNVRAVPVNGEVRDQINAFETVQLLEKTADGTWYRIINEREVEGWVSVTLLSIDANVVAAVPIEGQAAQPAPDETDTPDSDAPSTGLTATVGNGGNVRAAPNLSGQVRDQINAFETVELLSRTADGTWYQIRNERDVVGWVSVTLLTIDANVIEQVPVAS